MNSQSPFANYTLHVNIGLEGAYLRLEVASFKPFFEKHGFTWNTFSWARVIYLMIRETDPQLLHHIRFDCGPDELRLDFHHGLKYFRKFGQLVPPLFGEFNRLEDVIERAAKLEETHRQGECVKFAPSVISSEPWQREKKKALLYLEAYKKEYTLQKVASGPDFTRVYLQEFPGIAFASFHFRCTEEPHQIV